MTEQEAKEWALLGFRLQIVLDHCGVKESKQKRYWEQYKQIAKENDKQKFRELIDQIYDDSLIFGEGKKI